MHSLFWISPHGDDAWEGSATKPFATLERARDAIRALRTAGKLPAGDVAVTVLPGVYELAATFELTSADSGRPDARVIYQAGDGASPRLLGGKRVTGWVPVADADVRARLAPEARDHVLQVDLRANGVTDFGELTSRGFARPRIPSHLELFFRGERMTLARWPNHDFARITAIPRDQEITTDFVGEVGQLENGFFFNDDRPTRWRDLDDVWIHGYWTWDWANSYERIASIDPQTHLVKTQPPFGNYSFRADQRIFFLNVLEELDTAGEFYLDRRSGILYFWPLAEIGPDDAYVSVMTRPLVSMEETSHVTLRGLTLEYGRGNGIEITGGEGVIVADCRLRNLGNDGIIVNEGAQHGVTGCEISAMGDGGIILRGGDRPTLTPAGHYAVNNHIHHLAEWSRCYQPGITLGGVGNRAAHNLIHDHPHIAIMIHGNEHVVELNEFHHVCMETGDTGVVYIGRDYTQRGNVIRHNYFHDIGGYGFGSMGVYLDDCTSGAIVYANVFNGVKRGILIGGGRDNQITNNLFYECDPALWFDARGLTWHDMVYNMMKPKVEEMHYHQPPYSERYPELANLDPYFAKDAGVPPEGNVFARNVSFGGGWIDLNMDATMDLLELRDNLRDADRRFLTWVRGIPQLTADAPTAAIGFERIPVERIGLQSAGGDAPAGAE